MNSKSTWTYVAIAAALFALIYFVEHPLRQKNNAAISTQIFHEFKPDSATRIKIRPAGYPEITARRTNHSWALTSPLEYPASARHIESTLQAIAQLNWNTYISPGELRDRPKAQEEFGFATPVASLSIENGDSVLHLLIGTNTPVGEQLYLQVLGDVGVYVVNADFLKFIPLTADDWRDTTLLPITNAVTAIKSRAGNKGFSLAQTNGSWRMPQTRADDAKVNALLEKTLALQVAAFETDNPQADLERFGLHTPEMELTFAAGTNVLAVLQIGKNPTNAPTEVFAKLQTQPHIFRVPLETLAEWRGSYTNFVDRHLANFAPGNIAQIEIRGTDQFVLQRADKGWKISGTNSWSVDRELVGEIFQMLNRAEVDIEKEVVTDFPAYGLEPPALRYSLKTSTAITNSIAAEIDFGIVAGKVFVRRLDEYPDTVKTLSAEQFARLPQASWQFRDRRVWNFDSNNVVSVTIQQHGQTRKLVRNLRGDWTFAAGSQGMINPFSFAEALHRLGDLTAVFWVAKGDSTSDIFAFKETDHRVALEIKRGEKTETLTLDFGGFSDFGTRYAATTLNGERWVFEFPWPLFFEVQDSLTIPPK